DAQEVQGRQVEEGHGPGAQVAEGEQARQGAQGRPPDEEGDEEAPQDGEEGPPPLDGAHAEREQVEPLIQKDPFSEASYPAPRRRPTPPPGRGTEPLSLPNVRG